MVISASGKFSRTCSINWARSAFPKLLVTLVENGEIQSASPLFKIPRRLDSLFFCEREIISYPVKKIVVHRIIVGIKGPFKIHEFFCIGNKKVTHLHYSRD